MKAELGRTRWPSGEPVGRVPVVVDTADPLRVEHHPSGAQLTFFPATNGPSYGSRSPREQ